MPQTCLPLRPEPMADSSSGPIAAPWATAVRLVCDRPPSNWAMLASMQCLAKMPSARATNGDVWTTLGGATATPSVSLRSWPLQLAAACAGAAPAVKTAGDAAGWACAPATGDAWACAGAGAGALVGGVGAAGAQATPRPSTRATSGNAGARNRFAIIGIGTYSFVGCGWRAVQSPLPAAVHGATQCSAARSKAVRVMPSKPRTTIGTNILSTRYVLALRTMR